LAVLLQMSSIRRLGKPNYVRLCISFGFPRRRILLICNNTANFFSLQKTDTIMMRNL